MSSNTKLNNFLREAIPAASHAELCQSVLPGLIDAIAEIARALRTAHTVSQAGNANAFGDDQLNVDVLAEEAVRAAVARCPAVATASSQASSPCRPTNCSPSGRPRAPSPHGIDTAGTPTRLNGRV